MGEIGRWGEKGEGEGGARDACKRWISKRKHDAGRQFYVTLLVFFYAVCWIDLEIKLFFSRKLTIWSEACWRHLFSTRGTFFFPRCVRGHLMKNFFNWITSSLLSLPTRSSNLTVERTQKRRREKVFFYCHQVLSLKPSVLHVSRCQSRIHLFKVRSIKVCHYT